MPNKKILMLTFNGIIDMPFGGPKGSIRNYKSLCRLGEVDVYTIKKKSTLQSLVSILTLQYPPLLSSDVRNVDSMIQKNDYDFIFFDGSLFGSIAEMIKKKYNKKIVTFYHNVEADYISVRFNRGIKKTIYYLLASASEQATSKYSDVQIVFTKRDMKRVESLYGTVVNGIVPLAVEDNYPYNIQGRNADSEIKCLFFGPLGTANLEAAQWFVDNVSEHINAKTLIAGNGFDEVRHILSSERVEIVGRVENLDNLYSKASCIVLPLFSGAGMKVKTCEALMYGKTIFGTDEAFVGYDLEFDKVGGLCNTAEEFINQINSKIEFMKTNPVNEYSRKFYLDKYSYDSTIEKLIEIIED